MLSGRNMLVRLRGMNLAHVDNIVEAQDDLKPLELSYLARKSSYDNQMRALVLATFCREMESIVGLSLSSSFEAMSERICIPRAHFSLVSPYVIDNMYSRSIAHSHKITCLSGWLPTWARSTGLVRPSGFSEEICFSGAEHSIRPLEHH